MKKIFAALILTAAIATPAMAQSYVQSNASGHMIQAQPGMGYDAYAYSPSDYDTTKINSPLFAMDPSPDVRLQLQKQSDMFNH